MDRIERLAVIVERCLESESAYMMFDVLSAVSHPRHEQPTGLYRFDTRVMSLHG